MSNTLERRTTTDTTEPTEEIACDMARTPDGNVSAILYARDRDEAQRYCTVLEDVRIPALVGAGSNATRHGIPVLVPEALQERACEVIASFEAANGDEWYDGDDHDDDDHDEDSEEDEEDVFPDNDHDDEGDLDDDPDEFEEGIDLGDRGA